MADGPLLRSPQGQATMPTTDFNGDGRDDILWRNEINGLLSNWTANTDGGFVPNDSNALVGVPLNWHVLATGDFNGDQHADILWADEAGHISDWLGTLNGGWFINDEFAYRAWHGPEWLMIGVGDFNGDGMDDLLWVDTEVTGQRNIWYGGEDGGFTQSTRFYAPEFQHYEFVNCIGDFNGDGRDDFLWRDPANGTVGTWLVAENGDFNVGPAISAHAFGDWEVAGTGDFNGDGEDDILWRSTVTGAVSDWLSNGDGTFAVNDAAAMRQVPLDWHIVGIGNYNQDAYADILWRNNAGIISDWLGTANGSFTINDAHALVGVPLAWHASPDWTGGLGAWDY